MKSRETWPERRETLRRKYAKYGDSAAGFTFNTDNWETYKEVFL